jgi:glycine cleavage system H protein
VDHEWILVEGSVATVGITDHAQKQLGDLVFVDLPEVGRAVVKGDTAGTIESVKAASDIYAPLTGRVVETNPALVEAPDLANSSPERDGWFFKIEIHDRSEIETLLDEPAYRALIA